MLLRSFQAAMIFAVFPLVAGIGSPLTAQLLEQLPEDDVTYPRGSLFIQDLDVIWTAAGEVHENASILIRDGVIVGIGRDLDPPSGVEVVDGRGRTAIPGIVDEHSHIAMVGTNEGSMPVVPEISVLDALTPDDFGLYRALTGGITTARIMHGSSNPIGGQSAVIKPRWGMESSRQLLVPGAPRAVKFALGENVTRKAAQGRPGFTTRYPASRPGVEALYVQAFTAARDYREMWEAYRADPAAFRVPPRRDLRLDALVDIMEDRILVHAHSYRHDEILMLMRVAERFDFRIDNFTHILEGYRVADELREHGAAASTFSDWWQFKLEAYNAIPHNATLMHEKGVLTAINSDIPWLQSFMKWEIAKPVQYGGASKEDALRMLTIHPATILGIADKVGSLEVGKQADVVLLTGDPFDAFSRVERTIVDGIVYFDSDREAETRGEPFNPLPETPHDRYVAADASRVDGEARSVERSDGAPENPRAGTVALVGATIHPVSGPAIEDGVLVMNGGRIQAVGPRGAVEIPEGARTVDVGGKHLYPGMMDPVTYLGLFEMGQVSQATDRSDTGRFNPHIRALGAYQPFSRAPAVARARGITSVLTAQTGGVIQGMGSVVDLAGDTFERAEIRGDGALMINLPVPSEPDEGGRGGRGRGPGMDLSTGWETFAGDGGHGREIVWAGDEFFRDGGHPEDLDGTEMAGGSVAPDGFVGRVGPEPRARRMNDDPEPSLDTEELGDLVEFLERAREFQADGTVAEAADRPFEPNVRGGDRVALEAMVPVLEGEVPVFIRADSEWQIRHVFLLMEEFPGLRPVIVGGVQAFRVAEELAERGVPVILTRTRSPTPDRDDSVAASMRNAAILHHRGVTIAFATDESADVRTLPEHAAIAVAHGLPEEEGLRAVTLRPAEILGLDDRMGSLDPGKRADILVTDGNPLQPLTRIEVMFIAGEEVDPRDNDHDRFYEHFRERN